MSCGACRHLAKRAGGHSVNGSNAAAGISPHGSLAYATGCATSHTETRTVKWRIATPPSSSVLSALDRERLRGVAASRLRVHRTPPTRKVTRRRCSRRRESHSNTKFGRRSYAPVRRSYRTRSQGVASCASIRTSVRTRSRSPPVRVGRNDRCDSGRKRRRNRGATMPTFGLMQVESNDGGSA